MAIAHPMSKKPLAHLLQRDEVYRLKYQELLNLNNEFSAMELDEPPMAFTYNVMEGIRTEQAQKPLKAAINKRIIIGYCYIFCVYVGGFIGVHVSKH